MEITEKNTLHPLIETLQTYQPEMQVWRRDIHQHPELAFEEERTAALVAKLLSSWGIETHTQIGGTGVVGKLSCGDGKGAIGLRADMDALPMQELNNFGYKSVNQGCFHGCGHDGHTAMLLGAAKYLSENKTFNGTVYFIFQPAEEGLGGALAMMRDGLFDRFPMDAIYGLHNMPGMEVGSFAIIPGPMMAATSNFDITITGVGGHGALPQFCVDPVVIAAEMVQALQSIISRNIDPLQSAVLSVTKIHGGEAYNVIPNEVTLAGGVRFFNERVGDRVKRRINEIADAFAIMHKANIKVEIKDPFVVLVNALDETKIAADVATSLVGSDCVNQAINPLTGSEDFSFMLKEKQGAYILLGNGSKEGGCMIHNPNYDFNDKAAVYGAAYWTKLVEHNLV